MYRPRLAGAWTFGMCPVCASACRAVPGAQGHKATDRVSAPAHIGLSQSAAGEPAPVTSECRHIPEWAGSEVSR